MECSPQQGWGGNYRYPLTVMADPNWPPLAGSIVWCLFPDAKSTRPGSKVRPALIVDVYEDKHVTVVYGTGQNSSGTVTPLLNPNFEIEVDPTQMAHRSSNLPEQTRFEFLKQALLPYTEKWFPCSKGCPPPLIGYLPNSLKQAARDAKGRADAQLKRRPDQGHGHQPKPLEVIFKGDKWKKDSQSTLGDDQTST